MSPRSTSPLINWGLPSPCPLLFRIPFCHLWGKETKGSQSGGRGVLASPALPPSPAQRRCSHQKRLLKDDLFYFSSDLSILGKTENKTKQKNPNQKKKKPTNNNNKRKKKDKIDHKKKDKKNQSPPNP
ncbi:hypothetical protein ACRRTK_006765 [Alexandromys fortis]